jgi:hypothetical protein
MRQDKVRKGGNGGRHGWWERFRRLVRYRLVVPLKRAHHHPPEHTARGVMVGLMWALTPTIGIQMGLCLVTWVIARRLLRWDFSLIVACAWTWTTNVITMLPVYYVLYVTGQLMLGRFDDLSGYREFLDLWHSNVGGEDDEMALMDYFVQLAVGWGLPLLVGCVPWSALGGRLGYVWSLRFVRRHREARHRRRQQRHHPARLHGV